MTPGSARSIRPALAIVAVCGVFLVWRIFYGADLTDEAFYVATARQFAMGARPFVDSWSALQLSGWLVSPLVGAWQSVAGGPDGLVLAMRAAYVVLSMTAAFAAFAFLRRAFDARLAVLASGVPLAFIPFLLPTLSYNTLALTFVAIGTSLVALAVVSDKGTWPAAAGGVALALAVVAYPTLVLVLVPAVLLVRLASPSWRVPAIAGGVMVLTGCLLAVPLVGGLPGVADVLTFNGAIGSRYAGGLQKMLRVVVPGLRAMVREPVVWAAAVVFSARLLWRRPSPWWVGAIMLVLATLPLSVQLAPRTVYLALWLLVGALALGPPAGLPRGTRQVLVWVLCAGAATGLAMGYSSTNAFVNVGVGALAVSATAIAVLAARAEEGTDAGPRSTPVVRSRVALAAVSLVAIAAIATGVLVAYRDESPLRLTARVPAGPFAGVFTTPMRADYLAAASKMIAPRGKADSRLTVYGPAPALYLVGDAIPVAPQMWLTSAMLTEPAPTAEIARYFAGPGHAPDVVVVDVSDPAAPVVEAGDLSRLYGGGFTRSEASDALEVWVRE